MTKDNGTRICRKSITAFVSFACAIVYEFIMPKMYGVWDIEFETKEYVFITLITLTATVLGIREWGKGDKLK